MFKINIDTPSNEFIYTAPSFTKPRYKKHFIAVGIMISLHPKLGWICDIDFYLYV